MGLSAQSWSIRIRFNQRFSDLPFSLPGTTLLAREGQQIIGHVSRGNQNPS